MSVVASKHEIARWWSAYPQTYGLVHGRPTYPTEAGSRETLPFGSRDFFERLDRTFYAGNDPLHTEAGFFAKIFPYERSCGKHPVPDRSREYHRHFSPSRLWSCL